MSAAERIDASGFAIDFPTMSGALPCTLYFWWSVYVKKECKVVWGCGVSEEVQSEPGRPAEGIQLRDRLHPCGMWRWRFVSFRVQLWHETGHPCRLNSVEISFCFQAQGVRSRNPSHITHGDNTTKTLGGPINWRGTR